MEAGQIEEAYPAAAAILRNAGWSPHPEWGVYTAGGLVMGGTPDGLHGFIKTWTKIPPGHRQHSADTPDTAEEAAQWLVDKYTPKTTKEEPPVDPVPESLEAEPGQQAAAPEPHPIGGGDEAAAAEDAGGAEDGTASGGGALLAHDGSAWEGDSGVEPDQDWEAEFEEVADVELSDETLATLELEAPSLGEDIAAAEDESQPSGGVVYFGDDIHIARLAKMGRLLEIATERKAELQFGWGLDEFRSLQNLIVRIDRGEATDDVNARERFDQISAYSRAMSGVDAFLGKREAELESYAKQLRSDDAGERDAARAAIAAFDPEADWP